MKKNGRPPGTASHKRVYFGPAHVAKNQDKGCLRQELPEGAISV